jgi:hypothetical protein
MMGAACAVSECGLGPLCIHHLRRPRRAAGGSNHSVRISVGTSFGKTAKCSSAVCATWRIGCSCYVPASVAFGWRRRGRKVALWRDYFRPWRLRLPLGRSRPLPAGCSRGPPAGWPALGGPSALAGSPAGSRAGLGPPDGGLALGPPTADATRSASRYVTDIAAGPRQLPAPPSIA